MYILAVDPGKRTGIAEVFFQEMQPVAWSGEDVPGGMDGAIEWLALYKPMPDVVVMEQWKKREGIHGVKDDASRVIGAVTQWAHTRQIPVVMQAPDGRLKRVPDWVLVKLYGDVFRGNKNRNIKEAVRHATSWAKSQKVKIVLDAFRDD